MWADVQNAGRPKVLCLFSRLCLHNAKDIVLDDETAVGTNRNRSIADALAVLVLLPNRNRFTVRTKERDARFEVDAQSALRRNLFSVLEERIGERPDSPHRVIAHLLEVGPVDVSLGIELVGEFCILLADEHEAHHVIRPLAVRILPIDALLVENTVEHEPLSFDPFEKALERALLRGVDDHDARFGTLRTLAFAMLIQRFFRKLHCRIGNDSFVRGASLNNNTRGLVGSNHCVPPLKPLGLNLS